MTNPDDLIRRGGVARLLEYYGIQETALNTALNALPAVRTAPDVGAILAVLWWYGEQARLARLIHSEGDAGRNALQADGGAKARAILAQWEAGK